MTILRGITWEHPRGYDSVVGAAKAYAAVEPGVEVTWEYRSLQAFGDAPIAQLSAAYDLMVIDHPHVPLAAEAGLLARLDDAGYDDELARLAEDSVGPSHASYAYRGHQYGLASDAAAHVAVYRPDLLPEPPRTWDEVLELAAAGRVVWPAKPIDAISSLITVAANAGAPANARSGVFLAEEDALAALDLLHRLTAYVPERNLADNPIQVAEQLSTSDQWWYAPLLFGYTNYSRVGFRPGRLKYTDMPTRGSNGASTSSANVSTGASTSSANVSTGASTSSASVSRGGDVSGSILAGAGIAVSATAVDLDAARAFALWLASADVQRGVYFDSGGQPGNSVAWEDERLNAETLDFFTGTRATFDGAYVRPRLPGFVEFQDTAAPLVNAALRRELTDRALVTTLAERAERLLVHP